MNKQIVLRIFDLLGSPIWVSTEDGQRVYEKIKVTLDAGHIVMLSFEKKEAMITAFLNAAVGQLYGDGYADEFLNDRLKFVGLGDDDRALLERTVQNAKRYFARKGNYDLAWAEGEDVDE